MKLPRLLLSIGLLAASALPAPAQTTAESPRAYRVLFVGNSLTYTNNLPALLRSVAASQGVPLTTETYASPGGTLSERWHDGHASAALRKHKFDVVVLQEQGGKLAACMANAVEQRKAPCAASMRAYRDLSVVAGEQGAKVLIFSTWASDERWQRRISRSARMMAEKFSATVFDGAAAIDAIRRTQPDSQPLPDGIHPSTQASLMLALVLYRDITGSTPLAKELRVTAPLLPVNAAVSAATPMESQPGLTGTGNAMLIPASLVEPLIKALPDAKSSIKMDPAARRR